MGQMDSPKTQTQMGLIGFFINDAASRLLLLLLDLYIRADFVRLLVSIIFFDQINGLPFFKITGNRKNHVLGHITSADVINKVASLNFSDDLFSAANIPA